MNQKVLMEDHNESQLYEIRLRGYLNPRWTDRFEGLSFNYERDGTTILSGQVVDQAALHGMLRVVRDLGLPLVSINHIDSKQANGLETNIGTSHFHP